MLGSVSEAVWRGGAFCSIERTLEIVGDRWSFLVLRQSLVYGMTRFSEFENALRIAPPDSTISVRAWRVAAH